MPALSPGHYEVSAQLAGFQTVVRSGIVLTVGAEALVNVALALGNVAESITVEGAAPLIETTTATITKG